LDSDQFSQRLSPELQASLISRLFRTEREVLLWITMDKMASEQAEEVNRESKEGIEGFEKQQEAAEQVTAMLAAQELAARFVQHQGHGDYFLSMVSTRRIYPILP